MRMLLSLALLLALPQDARIRELLERLEDDRAETRELAQKELSALGEAALPALREAVESARSSGELKLRAGAAIREIEKL